MRFHLWRWLETHRSGGIAAGCVRLWRSLVVLLRIPAPEGEQLFRRITTMERDIVLPVKAAGIAMLLYSFYHEQWMLQALDEFSIAVVEWTRHFFWYYIPANVIFAGCLLAMRRLPLGLVQWMVFVSGLLDVIFLSALVVLTAGYQSFLYWLYLALIVRSAVSVPRATSQLALHLTIIICFVMAGVINLSIDKLSKEARSLAAAQSYQRYSPALNGVSPRSESTDAGQRPDVNAKKHAKRPAPLALRNAAADFPSGDASRLPEWGFDYVGPEEAATQPLVVRLVLLVLMAACSYGVQVLLERQRQAVEEEREFAVRDAQLRSAGRFAGEFAHQIKNPLAIINNAAFSLHRGLKHAKTEVREQVEMIQEEVERADRIITEVMGYAQLAEGHVEKLNVVEELDHAIARVFPPAARYPIEVRRDYAPGLPPLLMQRRHAAEIFINILQNAREAFGAKGGKVVVGARYREDGATEISICDNGPGIPPDKLERIFEAYYTTKEKGSGLGLATVKQNAELYGGTVRVESELGKGSRFILLFPAKALMNLVKANR